MIVRARVSGVHATIRRRVLLNYRLPPEHAAHVLPPPLRPRLVGGFALAGLCVIRLEHLRPTFVPMDLGITSDNAAHRIAIEWTDADGIRHFGVYILRRDTDSRLVRFAGNRLLPSSHSLAAFMSQVDADGTLHESAADARGLLFALACRPADRVAESSVFDSIAEASSFFESGSDAYSPGADTRTLDGIRLESRSRSLQPLQISHAYVRELLRMFPVGSLEFDSAFVLCDVDSAWRCLPPLPFNPRLRHVLSTTSAQDAAAA